MPAIKDVKSLRQDAGESVLPELESAELGDLEFEFQEAGAVGWGSAEAGSLQDDAALEFESVELESSGGGSLEVDSLGYKTGGFGGVGFGAVGFESVGLESAGFESVEIESVEIESMDIESVEIRSVEIESVEIESVEIESEEIESREVGPGELELPGIERPRGGRVFHDARGNAVWKWSGDNADTSNKKGGPGALDDFDLNDLEIEDHAGQLMTFGGGYDPYNQSGPKNNSIGARKGGGAKR